MDSFRMDGMCVEPPAIKNKPSQTEMQALPVDVANLWWKM